MGRESLKKRKGEDKGREDRESIQSHEPQTMNLQKQANLFLFPFGPCVSGWQREAEGDICMIFIYDAASAYKNHYCVPV